jgi:hypothetical protein
MANSQKINVENKKNRIYDRRISQILNDMPSAPHLVIGDQAMNQSSDKKVLGVIIDY